jgi:hypothetical protein
MSTDTRLASERKRVDEHHASARLASPSRALEKGSAMKQIQKRKGEK